MKSAYFLFLQKEATDYDTWLSAARRLDLAEGFTEWRNENSSTLYDYKLIQNRIEDMKKVSAPKARCYFSTFLKFLLSCYRADACLMSEANG